MEIKTAEFVTSMSVYLAPDPALPQIAVAGKSNVGKSSLINSLCRRKALAKTSATPGKTRLINFFELTSSGADVFSLVDLPGYGYAKASREEQKSWGSLIEAYLASGRVTHLFLLLDIRHPPTVLDRQMYSYILYYGLPFTLIATKSDKLSRSGRAKAAAACAKELGAPGALILPFSAETGEGKDALLGRIGDILRDARSGA